MFDPASPLARLDIQGNDQELSHAAGDIRQPKTRSAN